MVAPEPPHGLSVVTAHVRVSVRGVPEIGYTHRFSVRVTWNGDPGTDERIDLMPPMDGDEVFSPSFAGLLNY